jgi:L-iditol 2-dehydrogenase
MARKAPVTLGHEAVGEVVEAGAGTGFRAGERVFVHHHAPCLDCRACRRGDHVHCDTWRRPRLIPGGLATHAVARAEAVTADTLRLPPDLPDDAATFIEPVACVVKSLERARLRPGDRVLVIGLGVMGLLHLMLLRRRPEPSLLVGADRLAARLARGAEHADAVIDVSRDALDEAVRRLTDGAGADVAIVGPGTVEALEAGRRSLAPGGTLVVFTPTPPEVRWPLPVHDVFFSETTVVPTYSAAPAHTREALRLLAGGLPVATLITHTLSLDEAATGYELVRASEPALKVIVRP